MRKSKLATLLPTAVSNQQKLDILTKWDGGTKVDDLCREFQISPATLYKWKRDKATDEDQTQRELKQLREQNVRLKKMYANLSMDHEILQEGYQMLKKWQAQDAKKK